MKKLLMVLLAVVLSFSSIAIYSGVEVKADYYDAGDEFFLEFILSDIGEEDIDFSHTPLYNADLQVNGREYTFTANGQSGYALMVEYRGENQTFYEIEELFFNGVSPFASCEGLPIYITHNTYLEYKNQAFYNLVNGLEVSEELIADYIYNGFNYFGGTTATFTNTTINIEYATKSTEQYSIQYDLPNLQGSAIGGCCAHTAGAIILTYYDRFCENIIPNYDPMFRMGVIVMYNTASPETIYLTEDLVDLMVIGEPHEGVTFNEFQLGMETYVEQQGYTYTTTNLFSGGSFNLNNYKNAVQSGKPVGLFLTNYTMSNGIREEDGYDVVGSGFCPISHVAAGCGYKIDTYYDANGNVITTRTYLKVASGLISYGIGYLSLNDTTTISKAISILVS